MTATAPPTAPPAASPPGDLPNSVYREMALTLRVGLVAALALLGGATVALVARRPSSSSASWISPNPLIRYLDPRVLASGLVSGAPEAYLTIGVYALVATPVVRVATGLYSFYRHGERRMGALTTVVLALLVLGLLVIGPMIR